MQPLSPATQRCHGCVCSLQARASSMRAKFTFIRVQKDRKEEEEEQEQAQAQAQAQEEQLAAAGSLWPCPSARRSAASTWPDVCTAPMPIIGMDCPGMLTNATTCCCPKEYCFVEPRFNSIIAVCRGDSCACGGARANSCAPGVSAGKQTSGPWHLATPC